MKSQNEAKKESSENTSAVAQAAAVPPVFQNSVQLSEAAAEPYYVQLRRQLQQMIEQGVLAKGSYMPPERDLADWLNVSRTTVKRAYDDLRKNDLLTSTQGRGGTMVRGAPLVLPTMSRLKGFTQEMQELGLTPSTRLLELRQVQDRTVASLFGRPSSAPLLRVLRLRMADGVVMTRELAWYDLTLASAMGDWDGEGSAYAVLSRECGIVMAHAEQTIEAVTSSEQEAQAFGFNEPAPCLLIKRKCFDQASRLVEYVEGTFRGDAYAYKLNLEV